MSGFRVEGNLDSGDSSRGANGLFSFLGTSMGPSETLSHETKMLQNSQQKYVFMFVLVQSSVLQIKCSTDIHLHKSMKFSYTKEYKSEERNLTSQSNHNTKEGTTQISQSKHKHNIMYVQIKD